MEKIWLNNYPPSVPHTIDPDQYNSIPEMLEESFKKYANAPCFINFGESLSFKEIDKLSNTYAGFLQKKCGLVKGDRVAIMMPNCLQYPVALFGALKAGMVNVNVSPLYTIEQAHTALKTSGAKCILVLENFAHIVEKAMPGTEIKYVIVTKLGDLFHFPKGFIFNFAIKHIKKIVPDWNIPNFIPFKKTILPFYEKEFKKPSLCREDLAYLQFTEGRGTGVAKCAMLTHRNFIANGLQCDAWFNPVMSFLKGTALAPLPFFKLISMSTHVLTFMRHGMVNNLITNPREISLLTKEIKNYPPSVMTCVRTIFTDLLFDETFQNLDFSSLKLVFSGGMTIPQALADHWQSVTKTIILQAYVLTESAPIAMITPTCVESFTGSIGLPLPCTEAKICNEKGEVLSLKEIGEIWIKGPQIMRGYWNEPEKTEKILTEDGWFKTGDIGYMDEKGYFYFVDRKEDLIKVDDKIVYSTEVEDIIRKMNNIKEVVIVNGASKDKKPIIKAYIVKNDFSSLEELSEESILTYCKRNLADYQVPNEIEFCKELPRSATGYVLRYQLRKNISGN